MVQRLPCKHETWFHDQIAPKKVTWDNICCNQEMGRWKQAEPGGSLGLVASQPSLPRAFQAGKTLPQKAELGGP